MKRPRIWYLVMNSHRARILRGLPAHGAAAGPEIAVETPAPQLRDLVSDKPARSFASAGGGRRSAVEPGSDPVKEQERAFLQEVVETLKTAHAREGFDGLVLIGSPEIVGLWRREAPADLQALVGREEIKNLVGLTGPELIAAIRAMEAG